MRRFFSLIICLCLLLACGCTAAQTESTPQSGKLQIVTTVFPIYDFVRAVGGDRVDIRLLIDPGTEVHTFDPTPSDIAAIYDCDLFFYIGGESEQWVSRVLADVNIDTVMMMASATLLCEEGHGHNHDHTEHHDEYDEHIWTSPENALSMLNAVRDALCGRDIENSDYYTANCAQYSDKIRRVQSEIHDIVNNSGDKFILVADRFPFIYFTTEFGLEHMAAFGGCATSTDISLKVMSELVDCVKEKKLDVAFYTELSSRAIANALADETGIALYELHSAHNVTADDFESGITYVDIMERNRDALEKGLK